MRSVYDIKHADDPDVATIIILPRPAGVRSIRNITTSVSVCLSTRNCQNFLFFFYFLRVAVSVYGDSAIQNILYKLM